MLDAKQRVRFARHRSLVELGDEGVLALLRAVSGAKLSDARAEAVRADYLERAGLIPSNADTQQIEVDLDAYTTAPYLREAAAACVGALHAVARIRVAAGLARDHEVPVFRLDGAPVDAQR